MKNFILILFVLIFRFLLINDLQAQRLEDVIYLSNGSIIHGMVLKDTTSNIIRIINHAGDTWVFERAEVDSVKRGKPFEYRAKLFNREGFEFNINSEFLIRSGSNAIGNAVIPGVNIGLGYRFNSYITTSAEVGMEFYEWMEIPLTAALRLRSSGRALSPLAFLRAGYTLPAEKRADDWDYHYTGQGGICTSAGIGIERIINENAAFLFTFSYHYQDLNYHLTPLHQWIQERDRTESYSRLRISLGYVFK